MNTKKIISEVLERTHGTIYYQKTHVGSLLLLVPYHTKENIAYHHLFFNEISIGYILIDKKIMSWLKDHGEQNPFIIDKGESIEEAISIMKERFINRSSEEEFEKDLSDVKQLMEEVHQARME